MYEKEKGKCAFVNFIRRTTLEYKKKAHQQYRYSTAPDWGHRPLYHAGHPCFLWERRRPVRICWMESTTGCRTSGTQKWIGHKRAGTSLETDVPALFLFMLPASFSSALSAWRTASAPPHFGNKCFRIGQRKPIIRTHPLSEKGSDYMGLSCVDKKDAIAFLLCQTELWNSTISTPPVNFTLLSIYLDLFRLFMVQKNICLL